MQYGVMYDFTDADGTQDVDGYTRLEHAKQRYEFALSRLADGDGESLYGGARLVQREGLGDRWVPLTRTDTDDNNK